ncbi:activator-dependent family glycosyltransferase [Thermocatellispora tengchongensis]|uniref:activator-dependent family glycosyltransferase n=1 Tax=Thermocatellispora tengchongensis TaxID=1073253 RepID=UPI003633B13F
MPAKTHLYNMVPLAWAMHVTGHEVVVASTPDAAGVIAGTGLPSVPLGSPVHLDEAMRREPRDPAMGQSAWVDIAEPDERKMTWDFVLPIITYGSYLFQTVNTDKVIDDMVAFAREWKPDLVIWDPLMFAAPIAARAVGAAHARMLWGPDLIGRIRKIFLRFLDHPLSEFTEDPLGDWLRRSARRYGQRFDEEMVAGQWTIDPTPQWLQYSVDLEYVPIRFVHYNGPSEIPGWALEKPDRPRIVLTLGLSKRELEGDVSRFLSAMLEAVEGLDVEVIATLDPLQLGRAARVPANVKTVDFVPLNTILQTSSAIVHHGGFGTFGNALARGVPQFLVPDDTWDTVLIGDHLVRRGAGMCIPPERRSPGELREAIQRIITDPSYRENALALSRENQELPGPVDLVPVLESLTAKHRVARG